MNLTTKRWLDYVSTVFIWASLTGSVQAADLVLTSSVKQTGILELYTSEGCSSCPPADRWLSSLKEEPGLWKEFIPLAFHVDYWDYIGWKDRFASPVYSFRQRQYAGQHSVRTVYTPGFIYNGNEWRKWFLRRYLDLPAGQETGVLKASIMDGEISMEFAPINLKSELMKLNVALLGFGLETRVKAGENSGRTLAHDFVVLNLKIKDLHLMDGKYSGSIKIPKSDIKAPRYGVAIWVNKSGDLSPLQAVGGWLPIAPVAMSE